MANETTYPLISQYTNIIWEAALNYMQGTFFMPRIVQNFTASNWSPRQVTEYVEGTINEDIGELEDLTPTLLERNLLARLTPQEHGVMYLMTDRRLEGDPEDVLADASMHIGYEMGKFVEQKLLGNFANFTGGSVGSAGAALSWQNLYDARARLAANNVPAPYNVVLHEYQWLDLASSLTIAGGMSSPAQLMVRDQVQSTYYIGSLNDMRFFVTPFLAVDGSDDTVGGMFGSQALAFDLRRGLRIEPERDASLRATELNATMVFAHGIWRPRHGIKLIGDAAAAGNAVTTNSDIAIFGSADDTSVSSGTDVVFDFVIVNNGSVISTDIEITLTIPAGGTYVSDSPTQGSYNSSTKVWTAGSLAPSQSARLRVVYDVTATGNYVGTVTSVTPSDNVAGNNTATVAITVA